MTHPAKTRIGELKAKGNDRAAADFVSSLQQLFCSFDGTAFLIRAVGSPVQACQNRGWVCVSNQSILSPVGPLVILPAALSIGWTCMGVSGTPAIRL
jgi:hypothetical protein